jgi:hemolysin III
MREVGGMAKHWTEENAAQERMNAWIHGLGFLMSIPAGIVLAQLAFSHERESVGACVVYGLSLSAMYLFSTLSHAVRHPDRRKQMRALDQGVIYTLIAGTFTPFIWSHLEGWSRVALLVAVWSAAAVGFFSKVFSQHRVDDMNPIGCLLLGWLPAVVLYPAVSSWCFGSMLLGGLLYSAGVLFLQNDHRAWYFHPLWHGMVVVASASHYVGIAMFAVLHWDR